MGNFSRNQGNLLTFGLLALVGLFAYGMFAGNVFSATTPVTQDSAQTETGQSISVTADSTTAVTTTFETNNKYSSGSAVTTQNMYRKQGSNTWTDVAGAATASLSQGETIDVIIGIDTNDEAAEPYGPVFKYTVPVGAPTAIIKLPNGSPVTVRNDALATDLTGTYFDENDAANTAITGVSAGDTFNLAVKWKGSFEEDFGNIFCENPVDSSLLGGEKGYGTLIVVKYNTTEVDAVQGVNIDGQALTAASVPVAVSNDNGATGFALKGWEGPTLESTAQFTVDYFLDTDDTVAMNTSISAFTWYLYTNSMYLDNDDNTVKCGVADEDDTLIGAASEDSIAPVIGVT